MHEIRIQRVANPEDRSLPVFEQAEALLHQVRERAFALAAARGRRRGDPMQDWLTAEREICLPATEFVDRDDAFVLTIALPGFRPDQIVVTATPGEVIVQATRETQAQSGADARIVWSDFRSNAVYRRIAFSQPIDVDTVAATLVDGLLKVVATKRLDAAAPAPVEQASEAA